MRNWIITACSLLGLGLAACSADVDDVDVAGGADNTGGETADTGSDAVTNEFKHPGLLMTKARLDNMKRSARSNRDSAIKEGWSKLTDNRRTARLASLDYRPHPHAVVHVVPAGTNTEETHFHEDGEAAYLHALQWVVTGNNAHKDKAIEILNAWGRTLTRLESTGIPEQVRLEAAWVAPMFANAAEIVRHYDGGGATWSSAQIRDFSRMLDVLYNYAKQTKDRAGEKSGNWGASGSYALMAIGVFQDNPDRYDEGKASLKKNIDKVIGEDGLVIELKTRDCHHPQYALEAQIQAAEVALSQGDEGIYKLKLDGQTRPRLALGLEYMGKSLHRGEGARDCRDRPLEAGYGEIAVRYYKQEGVSLPNFERVVKEARPVGYSDQFLGWNTLTHGLDY